MQRILVVDADPTVLSELEHKLANARSPWSVEHAASRDEALERLTHGPYDAVLSSPSIVGADGSALLAEVKRREPSVLRLMLVSPAERDLAQKLAADAHQSLPKNASAESLRSALSRGIALRDVLGNERLQTLVAKLDHLPSVPSLYFELVEAMKAPDAKIESLGRIIARDPGMTSKVLRTVNSAVFGLRETITSPGQAATFLGLDMLKSLVLSVGVFSQYDGQPTGEFSIEECWQHNLRVASFTRAILQAERAGKATIEEGVLAGMMHDAGQLVLATNRPERFQAAHVFAERDHAVRAELERRLFGASHAAVGGYLLDQWGLPTSVVEAVLFHHTPSTWLEDDFSPLCAVHVANALAGVDLEDADAELVELDYGYLERLGLARRLSRWIQACRDAIEDERGATSESRST
ncbi:MAG: HDOD domain-containing protein [Planctomycetes bacterium]|nr:HDOD domain-containing protein [Planctomycetota bacterium]